MNKRCLGPILLFLFCLGISPAEAKKPRPPKPKFKLSLIAEGIQRPIYMASPRGDDKRLFVVEQTGKIWILESGKKLESPFLDVGHKMIRLSRMALLYGSEQGLLGLAFHPDFLTNGRFFVHYTDLTGTTAVEEYGLGATPDEADPQSGRVILNVKQPYPNHNGGQLAFGPDGYLYISLGDGGAGGDPHGHGQNTNTLLGSILRLDVDQDQPYTIPADNPFVGKNNFREEIWAYGLRNPWRFSFDFSTGDLWIGDVGQNRWEEVDRIQAPLSGGLNFGWNIMEGNTCYRGDNCASDGLTPPVHVYPINDVAECSVVGGYVYRGTAIPSLQGSYIFADYCSARIWRLTPDQDGTPQLEELTAALNPDKKFMDRISSFGRDGRGEIFISDNTTGKIFSLSPR